jgi:hypothetical protein
VSVLESGRQYRFVWQVVEVEGRQAEPAALGAVKIRELDITINTVTKERSGQQLLTPAKE